MRPRIRAAPNVRTEVHVSSERVTEQGRRHNPFKAHSLKAGLRSVLDSPYLCLALLMAGHYSLWFVPNATGLMGITSMDVTFTWLLTLGFTGLFLIVFPLGIRKIDTGDHRTVVPVAATAHAAATLCFCFAGPYMNDAFVPFGIAIACVFGACTALIWIFGGASCTRAKVTFAVRDVAPVFASVVAVSMVLSMLLPTVAAALLAAAFPPAAALAHRRTMKTAGGCPTPALLPQKSSAALRKSAIILGLTGGVLSASDTFATCIIPTDLLVVGFSDNVLAWSLAGGVIIVSLALLLYAARCKENESYTLIPLLMALSIVALAMVMKGGAFSTAAFTLGIGACVILEVLLLTFFGSLATKGYLAPAIAFGLCEGVPRLGSCLGNCCAVFLEQNNLVSAQLVQDTCLIAICAIGFLIIAATRQQHAITTLANAPLSAVEVDSVCDEASADFGLSPRETEILKLLARGASIEGIAKKFVISPYTVQTHIQHIYRKMGVHKRSELMDYINLRRDRWEESEGKKPQRQTTHKKGAPRESGTPEDGGQPVAKKRG